MLAVTRELVLGHLAELSTLVNKYGDRQAYVQEVLAWCMRVEQSLGRVRSPLASLVAAERGRILATPDGLRDPEVKDESNKRKVTGAMAAVALGRVEGALRGKVAEIDAHFDSLREKLASFLGAVSVKQPIPLPPPVGHEREAWIRRVWSSLGSHAETRALYSYLNAAMAPQDRIYLLDDVLTHLIEGDAPPPD